MRCLTIPGADALENHVHRELIARSPYIMGMVARAEETLRQYDIHLDLRSFFTKPNEASHQWFVRLAVATIPVQYALYQLYQKEHGTPDIVLSCSLGDISRNVCIGVASFELALLGMHQFAQSLALVNDCAAVRFKSSSALTATDRSEIQSYGLYVGIAQTPHQLLIGGQKRDLMKWIKDKEHTPGARINLLYPYPLHTPLMQATADVMVQFLENASTKPPSTRTFSTLNLKWLETPEDFKTEVVPNILSTVHWSQSVQLLSAEFPGIEFINLGPSETLTIFSKKSLPENRASFMDFFGKLSEANFFNCSELYV